jgi:hypothetical protein
MLAGLFLAIRSSKNAVTRELRDPAMLSLLALMCFSTIHLTTDIAVNGMYAIRDSSLFFEGIFLLLGLLWAREEGGLCPMGLALGLMRRTAEEAGPAKRA